MSSLLLILIYDPCNLLVALRRMPSGNIFALSKVILFVGCGINYENSVGRCLHWTRAPWKSIYLFHFLNLGIRTEAIQLFLLH